MWRRVAELLVPNASTKKKKKKNINLRETSRRSPWPWTWSVANYSTNKASHTSRPESSTNDARCTREITSKSKIAIAKHIQQEEETSDVLHLEDSIVRRWNLRQFGKQIRNTWEVWKCGVEARWRLSGPIVWKIKKVLQQSKTKGASCIQQKGTEADWIGHILRRNCLLKYVIKGKIEGTGIRGKRSKQLV